MMISVMDSSLSALSAYSVKMRVTANNVANVNTDGFKKSRTTMQEGTWGGVAPDVDRVDTPGMPKQIVEDGVIRDVEASNVDLAEEITDTLSTQTAYQANLKAVEATDEMLGNLLDAIG